MEFIFDNNTPIYLQLVWQLKKYIISGYYEPGSRLPSVRDLALQCKVNPNTMQKALVELEEMKLIYTERTNGKFVTGNVKLIEKYRKEYAKELMNDFFTNMESIGFSKEETLLYIEEKGGIK